MLDVNPVGTKIDEALELAEEHLEALKRTKIEEEARGEWRQLSDAEIDGAVSVAADVVMGLRLAQSASRRLANGEF